MRIVPTILLLVAVACSPSAFAQNYRGLYTGGKGDDGSYHLSAIFGIEQWEQGKLTKHRHQQWWLDCTYPDAIKRAETWCGLDRVVIDKGLTPNSGAVIGTHKHYTSDGTLQIVRADWSAGVLDFTVILQDKTRIEVMARLKISDGSIYLTSFKATAIARGLWSDTLSTIDYKIPSYGYTLNVPIEMRGFKSASDKEWDDMLASLSKKDRTLWEELLPNLLSECGPIHETPEAEIWKSVISNQTRRAEIEKGQRPTPEEDARFAQKFNILFIDYLTKCLGNSEISKAGQDKVIGLFRKRATRND